MEIKTPVYVLFGLFLLLQIILFTIAKFVHREKETKKQKNERILKSHNKVRSISINMLVAIVVIFIAAYTNEIDRNHFISNFNGETSYSIAIIIFTLVLFVMPIVSYCLDKDIRIPGKELRKMIFQEFLICLLTVGFVYALLFQSDTAFFVSGILSIFSIGFLLFI